MGLKQTVDFPGPLPDWSAVHELLAKRGIVVHMRMIDGELVFPEDAPAETWRELRVSGAAGMVTLRRDAGRITLVTWGNAEPPLLQLRNALAWAFAAVGAGRIQMDQTDQSAADFLSSADLPEVLRA
jgi:hypothetical protein